MYFKEYCTTEQKRILGFMKMTEYFAKPILSKRSCSYWKLCADCH